MPQNLRVSTMILVTMWVAVRLGAAHQITRFPLPVGAVNPWYAAAPDGSVWFTILDGNAVARVTEEGAISLFPIDDTFSKPYGVVVTPNGDVWFGSISRNWIKRIDSSGVVSTLFLSGNTRGLCVAPDGFVYATIPPDRIARISPTGSVVEYSLPFQSSPHACAADKQGSLWYTALNTNAIGRLFPDGVAIEYRFPTAEARSHESIVLGADGNMWFTERQAKRVGRITPSGAITEFNATGSPTSIATGAHGELWFVQGDNTFTPTLDESAFVRLTYSGGMTEYPLAAAPMGLAATSATLWIGIINPANELWRVSLRVRRRAVRH